MKFNCPPLLIFLCVFANCLAIASLTAYAQPRILRNTMKESGLLKTPNAHFEMPFNRIIGAAGETITYGDPELENHTLDLTSLSDKRFIAIEDRYGIAILNSMSKEIISKWSFNKQSAYKDLTSTYAGITSFVWNSKEYIFWGAAGRTGSFVMMAEWDGTNIQQIKGIKITENMPAKLALPNQVLINIEKGVPYLYIVLNGNNQLMKIRFEDQAIIWSTATGVAPYGMSIIHDKAYITNWAGSKVTDSSKESAGTPWGSAYTNPTTGATLEGTVSVIALTNGKQLNEIKVGLHPNAIIQSHDKKFLFVANGNSDNISMIDVAAEKVIATIEVGLFSKTKGPVGSSPNALCINNTDTELFVANGMDNAIAKIVLKKIPGNNYPTAKISGYIPTEAYPSGLLLLNQQLIVTNLEAKGASVLSPAKYDKGVIKDAAGKPLSAYSIHQQLASISIIPLPTVATLKKFTQQVLLQNYASRLTQTYLPPRIGELPKPMPERIGEPSVFKHVIYIIKENKTYDQVFGDIKKGRGDERLCIYGEQVTPNQHQLVQDFSLLDNYYASGKSSAEGHQWTDAAMVSDYIEKNVRSWFRSYPHRQEDALVSNKNGFIWNNALDHGKTVKVYGEACTTHYDSRLKWIDFYTKRENQEIISLKNTTTRARLRPIISPDYPDCDNINLPDQLRADVFIRDWKAFEAASEDKVPNLMVLSLPNDHTSGTSPNFPTPRAMVADNDLAVGRIIETISHSRFWDSTVIFITEDDSQSGWDHISAYRTTALVISPYSVLGAVNHANYNQTSIVRSIEQILGIPPMNGIDATAMPMFDCFGNKKTNYQYNSIKNKIPLNEMNKPFSALKGKALDFAKLSANKVFKDIDGGEDALMNQILWFDAKGEAVYPLKNN